MVDLGIADFPAYFEAVHGQAPFPWQARLLGQVARAGEWPALLDLPTGAGKTAAIDVALFHLALDAATAPAARKAPRRIALVVDRRTVVDQAFERAAKIAGALGRATGGVLGAMADRLRSLAGLGADEAPLGLAQLRGGMPRDEGWARRPDQALVVVSTVDQVGSRLLFRGYGVSEAMRPIHAGLLGNDTLVLLDEVHLSRPFQATLEALGGYRGWTASGLPDRWRVVEMSATPVTMGAARDDRPAFGLDAEDREDPRLAKRLGAKKPAARVEVKVSGGEDQRRAVFAEACAARAAEFATPGRVVGVVVNRVATAREVVAAVRGKLGAEARAFLVTGRMRPLDREDLEASIGAIARSGRDRREARAAVIVATQCIEAGADLDFDALVTECAPLDALRQRFGRLNRLGELDDARAAVMARSDAVGKDASDPIYGGALAATWAFLGDAPRDFGIDAMAMPSGEALARLLVAPDRAPVMLPAHLDLWAQTKPTPRPDPDVSLWLHGVDRRQEEDVRVVWRADVPEGLLAAARVDEEAREALRARVDVCPPVGLEAMAVSVHAVRAWLASEEAPDMADVEGREVEGAPEERRRDRPQAWRPAWLCRGDEGEVIGPRELRPGATIVVPTGYGGITEGTWDPASRAPVTDLGDRARRQATGRSVLRLHPALLDPTWPRPREADREEEGRDDRAIAGEWIDAMEDVAIAEPWRRAAFEGLKSPRRRAVVRLEGRDEEPGYLAIVGRAPSSSARGGGDVTTEDDRDRASHTGVAVPLHVHMKGVADWARGFAERCGLPAEVIGDLTLAGRWHDAGKVDPRFQRMLHGGSAFKAETAPEPLAKGRTMSTNRKAMAEARARSRYPAGARHELGSVALLEACAPLLEAAADRDLVLHLVASHHGHCRPFAPVVEDAEPVEMELRVEGDTVARASSAHGLARLDSPIAARFWRLVERYGWFGLAWLEAVLRLADHRRSEEEQRKGEA